MKELIFSSFITISTLGVLACLLALCALCRRKRRKQAFPQDSVRLVGAPLLRLTELSESATGSQKMKRTNSRGKNQGLAGIHLPLPLREEDGTASVSSFIILTQRQLPHVPSEDLSTTEEMYSNLTFSSPTQEVLYESVAVMAGERDQSHLIKVQKGLLQHREDQARGAEYAHVLKAKKKEEPLQIEAVNSPGTAPQQLHPAETALNLHTAQMEAMYSVVCKAGRKTKATKVDGEERPHRVETSQRDSQLPAVHQEPDSKASCRLSSSSRYLVPEPCYDSVSGESWVIPGRREVAEPAYEAIGTHWKRLRRKGKANPYRVAENLYESI